MAVEELLISCEELILLTLALVQLINFFSPLLLLSSMKRSRRGFNSKTSELLALSNFDWNFYDSRERQTCPRKNFGNEFAKMTKTAKGLQNLWGTEKNGNYQQFASRTVQHLWDTTGSFSSNFKFLSKEMWKRPTTDERRQNNKYQLAWQTVAETIELEPNFLKLTQTHLVSF